MSSLDVKTRRGKIKNANSLVGGMETITRPVDRTRIGECRDRFTGVAGARGYKKSREGFAEKQDRRFLILLFRIAFVLIILPGQPLA
jgi:hypothetical protein